jgi:hypothetical protein
MGAIIFFYFFCDCLALRAVFLLIYPNSYLFAHLLALFFVLSFWSATLLLLAFTLGRESRCFKKW